MSKPVQLEKGDYIAIDITKGVLWIEKGGDIQTSPPTKFPERPSWQSGTHKRHSPEFRIFSDKKDAAAWHAAYALAYTVAWCAGLDIVDDTELFLKPETIYIFRAN